MTTQTSTKLAALGIALMLNGVLFGGVGYLFSAKFYEHAGLPGAPRSTEIQSLLPTI